MSVARTLDEEGSIQPEASQLLRVPFSVSSLDVFEDNESLQESDSAKKESAMPLSIVKRNKHSLIPYTEIVMQNYFNEHLFNFFYADEEVTCTLVFNSADVSQFLSPAQVNGTNYGRILISPFFQRHEAKVNPILVIDSHMGLPISGLFVADKKYLISASSDGTVCVTDLLHPTIE